MPLGQRIKILSSIAPAPPAESVVPSRGGGPRDEEEEEGERVCSICLDHKMNAAMYPCGHRFYFDCVTDLLARAARDRRRPLCPKCNSEVREVIKTFD